MFSMFKKGPATGSPAGSQTAPAQAGGPITHVTMTVNGRTVTAEIDPRMLLAQFVR